MLVLAATLLQGCVVSKKSTPNVSIIDEVQEDPLMVKEFSPVNTQLLRLYDLDSHLAIEIGRLPEFQQETVSQKSLNALKKFIRMYEGASKGQIDHLKIVIDEGYAEVRKFSAPLQAIIWLLQNDKVSSKNTDIFSLSFQGILLEAWNFSDHHWKGKGLEEVTDRLSSPRLIGYYVRYNFSYESKRVNQSTARDFYSIFKYKKGNCQGYADFQNMCLKKAGYRAGMIKVKGMLGSPYHVAVEFEDKDGVMYVIDNSYIMFGGAYGISTKEQYVSLRPQIGRGKD